jgi:hypothetical protein
MHSITCKKYQYTLQPNVNNGQKIHVKKRVRQQGVYILLYEAHTNQFYIILQNKHFILLEKTLHILSD